MPSAGFEPSIPAIERPQTYALNGTPAGIDNTFRTNNLFYEPRLATDWTVRGSNPVGDEILRIRPDRHWGPPSLLYNGYQVFPGSKVAGAWS
jgi:hypothetical protein